MPHTFPPEYEYDLTTDDVIHRTTGARISREEMLTIIDPHAQETLQREAARTYEVRTGYVNYAPHHYEPLVGTINYQTWATRRDYDPGLTTDPQNQLLNIVNQYMASFSQTTPTFKPKNYHGEMRGDNV